MTDPLWDAALGEDRTTIPNPFALCKCGHEQSSHELRGKPAPCQAADHVGVRGLHRSGPMIATKPCRCHSFRPSTTTDDRDL